MRSGLALGSWELGDLLYCKGHMGFDMLDLRAHIMHQPPAHHASSRTPRTGSIINDDMRTVTSLNSELMVMRDSDYYSLIVN
jgi:hypothetical protein